MKNIEGTESSNTTSTSDKKSERRGSNNTGNFGKQAVKFESGSELKSSNFSEWFKSKKPNREDISITSSSVADKEAPAKPSLSEEQSQIENQPDKLSDGEKSTIASLAREHSQNALKKEPEVVKEKVADYYDQVINEHEEPEEAAENVNEIDLDPSEQNRAANETESKPADEDEVVMFDRLNETSDDAPDVDNPETNEDPEGTQRTHEFRNPFIVHEQEAAAGTSSPPEAEPTPLITQSPAETRRSAQENAAGFTTGLVGGGIMNYLMGKRRGRIQNEAKFRPVQRKLEKQVKDYSERLLESEAVVRAEARKNNPFERANAKEAEVKPKPEAKAESKPAKKNDTFEALVKKTLKIETRRERVNPTTERIAQIIVPAAAETLVSTKPSKKAEKTERLGAKPELKAEKNSKKPPETIKIKEVEITVERVDKLNRRELLEVSKKIKIEGSSLKEIYENHLIGERGLRRLVKEYLHGGNLQRAYRREFVQRQIDFERDPILRDRAAGDDSTVSGSATATKAALESLISKATASMPGGSPDSQSSYEDTSHKQTNFFDRRTDMAIVATIAFLLAAIIVIYLSKH
jgi:hypothetical protein